MTMSMQPGDSRAIFLRQAAGRPADGFGTHLRRTMPPGNRLPVMGPVPDSGTYSPIVGDSPVPGGLNSVAPQGGGGFNKFAAGAKGLGATPNLGPVGDKSGYKERDRNAAVSRNALLRRLKARQQGRFMSNDNLYGEM